MQINFQIFYASAAFTVDPQVGVSCRGEAILENSICLSVTVVARCVSRNTPRDFLSLPVSLNSLTIAALCCSASPSLSLHCFSLSPLYTNPQFTQSTESPSNRGEEGGFHVTAAVD